MRATESVRFLELRVYESIVELSAEMVASERREIDRGHALVRIEALVAVVPLPDGGSEIYLESGGSLWVRESVTEIRGQLTGTGPDSWRAFEADQGGEP